jgi:hypothetical protein
MTYIKQAHFGHAVKINKDLSRIISAGFTSDCEIGQQNWTCK